MAKPQKLYDVSYAASEYKSGDESKTEWNTIGAIYKSDDGNVFMKLDTTALNPSVVMQMMKMKKSPGRQAFLSLFKARDADKPAAGDDHSDGTDNDEIPF